MNKDCKLFDSADAIFFGFGIFQAVSFILSNCIFRNSDRILRICLEISTDQATPPQDYMPNSVTDEFPSYVSYG